MMVFDLLHSLMAWAKTSRLKIATKSNSLMKQVQSVQCHLSLLRKRKECMLRHSRADIAQLLRDHQLQKALDRVKQLHKDQCLLAAYDQIEHCCQCIATNIPHIRSHGSLECLAGDVIEAISSLVFAAPRCGELPELNKLRNLLKKHFGYYKSEVAIVEMHMGSLVSSKMKQNLCTSNIVSDDEKFNIIQELADEHSIQLRFQDLGKIPFHSKTEINSRNHNKNAAVLFQQEALKTSTKIMSDPLKKKKNNCVVSFKNCHSLDNSIDKLKQRKGKFCHHVHPKLPDYEDIVAKLTDLKMEHKRLLQRKRFSFC